MSILCNESTRLLVQGITGKAGKFHAEQCLKYGTRVVAGVTPGKGGIEVSGIPVFNTVFRAVRETEANASIIFVPSSGAADAIMEQADMKIPLVVCITEGIPQRDMVNVMRYLVDKPTRLIGPNCPGLITPAARCKVGIMPGFIHKPGSVGVVSRSGTLTYEAVDQLTRLGIGQSTCVGIGGDPILGSTFVDILQLFENDNQTRAVLMIGEIGGNAEEDAALFIREKMTKPVVAFVAGKNAPPGKRMGHAGAIIRRGQGTTAEKMETLRAAGVIVCENPAAMGKTVAEELRHARMNHHDLGFGL